LKYQKEPLLAASAGNEDLLTFKVRYLPPEEKTSRLLTLTVKHAHRSIDQASADFRFASAVATFGMLLRDSSYKGIATYGLASNLARSGAAFDPHGYRAEFIRLVDSAAALAGTNRSGDR